MPAKFSPIDRGAGGIRELCSLTDDPDFEEYPAMEFLQLFNVVGVPAAAAIADYPDPAVFHCDAYE